LIFPANLLKIKNASQSREDSFLQGRRKACSRRRQKCEKGGAGRPFRQGNFFDGIAMIVLK
jgi:hypothetical protein